MKKKKKIVFIIPSLRAGGAERIMSFIAENLNKEFFETTLLVIGSEENASYRVTKIPVVFLNKNKVRSAIPALFKYLLFHKIDLVVSAIGHLNTVMAILAVFFPRIKFVARETIVRSAMIPYQDHRKKWFDLSIIQRYTLDAIICQSNDMKKDLIKNYHFPEKKLVIINNPITKEINVKAAKKNNPIRYITVGRVVKQKGYKRLLKLLAKLEYPFQYIIVGNGKEMNAIFRQIEFLGLEDNVIHIPFTKKVEECLELSDVFLQGSYVEGFPNALIESCAVGTPVIAFNAPGGINEIIENGVNGYIVNTEEEFIALLNKTKDFHWDPRKVSESVTSRYHKNSILKKYEALFNQLTC
ncbi:glycosyltransferase [Leptobacterium sp. I13]|uniref:glycosyltransferase n=1 Tax=Leptobacterium meishanense TaxID=3128904 RepID=UPI0030EBE1AD